MPSEIKNILFKKINTSRIYKIKNKITGDIYIGQSKNVSARLLTHLQLLRNDHHLYRNGERSLLQKSWNKYKENNFSFEIVTLCTTDELNDKEIYYINFFKCNYIIHKKGFNMTDGGQGTSTAFSKSTKGYIPIYKEDIQKRIPPNELEKFLAQGWQKGIKPSIIKKSADTRTGKYTGINSPNYGKRWKLSKPRKPQPREAIERARQKRLGQKNTWAKPLSTEHKQKISAALKGRKMPKDAVEKSRVSKYKPIIQLTKQNEFVAEYRSGIEAEEKTGIGRTHIASCCNRNRKTAGGYKWMFKENYDEFKSKFEFESLP